jgi:ribose transport system permease protein
VGATTQPNLTPIKLKKFPLKTDRTSFRVFGQGELLAVPVPVVIFLGAAAVLVWMLAKSRFGRNIYAIGVTGMPPSWSAFLWLESRCLPMAWPGCSPHFAGILYASRMDAGQPAVGEGWLMGAITAAILGGTSLKGGQGTILGTVFGTLLMAVVSNGLLLLNVSGYWEHVVVGAIVLVAVLGDLLRRRY